MMSNLDLVTLIELFLVVLAVATVVKVIRIPYTVALVIAGLVVGFLPGLAKVTLTPELILTIFLPVLLFEGAYNLPVGHLRANLLPVSLLAIPGVLVSTLVTAAFVHWALGLEWAIAILFGTLIAATDPIAVLALFREVGAPRRLATIVEGESLLNDGIAFVLFTIVLGIVVDGTFSIAAGVRDFFVSVAGAIAIGALIGLGGSLILRFFDDYLIEVTATFVAAYGAFVAAESFHLSGVIAVVTAGLCFGSYGALTAMSPRTSYAVFATWEFASFLANSLIFLLIGLALDTSTLLNNWWALLVAVVGTLIGRAVSVYGLSILLRGRARLSWPFRHVMFWGGLRGALSLALALSLPITLANDRLFVARPLLLAMAFGVVGTSLLLQGLTIAPLVRLLGLTTAKDPGEEAQGRLHADEAALRNLERQYARGEIGEVQYHRLQAAYQRQQADLRRQLTGPGVRAALLAEQAAVRQMYDEGTLSRDTAQALDAEIAESLRTVDQRQDTPDDTSPERRDAR